MRLQGTPEEMIRQVLAKNWVDKSKTLAIVTIKQYAEFMGLPVPKTVFRTYNNTEMYVPTPEMIKQLIYRIRSVRLRAAVMLAVETGATAGEICSLRWQSINLRDNTVTIVGVKGHRTDCYKISADLVTLLQQLPREHLDDRVFPYSRVDNINNSIRDYKFRLAHETGNTDFFKIHFHTLRHYAISLHYFRSKDVVATQRFARHCNIQNTLRYVHIIKSWNSANTYDVVYATEKSELTRYLSEGYEYVTKTEYGYCLRKPKQP